mgnify:CR=1 FL=1
MRALAVLLTSLILLFIQIESIPSKSFMICGDTQIILIDYHNSTDTKPKVIWEWDARQAKDLPEDFRTKHFNTVDDCKSVNNGKQILVSSSSGAIAIIEFDTGRIPFYTAVPNAHSIEILPFNRLVAASSVNDQGNKIMLFDISKPNSKPVYTDSLESAHGVVWDKKRNSLYTLGYNVSREYKMPTANQLTLKEHWPIKGIDGHDLQMVPNGDALFLTEHTGAWLFNLTNYRFQKISNFPDSPDIKSLGQDASGQYIYTIPEESYWTFHVHFYNPSRNISFPSMHIYKARWFNITIS